MMHNHQICTGVNGEVGVGFLILVVLLAVLLSAMEHEHHSVHTFISLQAGDFVPCPVAITVKLGGVQAEEGNLHPVLLVDVGGLLTEVANTRSIQGGLGGFVALLPKVVGVIVGQVAGLHAAFQQNVHIVRRSTETVVFFRVLLGTLVRQGTFQIHHSQVILFKQRFHLGKEVSIPFLCRFGHEGSGLILLGFLTAQGNIPGEGHSNGFLRQDSGAYQHQAEKKT